MNVNVILLVGIGILSVALIAGISIMAIAMLRLADKMADIALINKSDSSRDFVEAKTKLTKEREEIKPEIEEPLSQEELELKAEIAHQANVDEVLLASGAIEESKAFTTSVLGRQV